MIINFLPHLNIYPKNSKDSVKNNAYPNLSPLKCDTISFGAMKKKEFKGTDLAVVEMFKAPIEKFNSNQDLQNWAKDKAFEIANKDYTGRQEETNIQRKAMLKEWFDYVLYENDGYSNTISLLILNAITKDLKPNNDEIPPVLNKGILADCIDEIDTCINKNPKYQFDLNKMYQNKLQTFYLEDEEINTGEFDTKWIVIPSKEHDIENFDANVDKLKVLSHKNWCTKSFKAKPYLEKGDFHVYIEKGKPKVGVRFVDDKIEEIQGEKNNGKIPIKYLDEIETHIKNNSLTPGKKTNKQIALAEKTKPIITKIKTDLKDAIEQNDAKTIFKYFRISVKEDKDGYLIISKYKQPSKDYTFDDLGINENELFKNVKSILKEANFNDSKLTELKNLQTIGKDAYFTNSKITKLGCLESIGGNAFFVKSKVTDLGNLKTIGGDADFSNSQITDLKNLQTIKKDAFFVNSQITNLGKLKYIGNDVYFEKSQIENLNMLQFIGGNVHISNSNLCEKDFKDVKVKGKILNNNQI